MGGCVLIVLIIAAAYCEFSFKKLILILGIHKSSACTAMSSRCRCCWVLWTRWSGTLCVNRIKMATKVIWQRLRKNIQNHLQIVFI